MINSTEAMDNMKSLIKKYAVQCGFDLVRVTGAEEFVQARDVALNRIKAGYMDGLHWFTESRVPRGADPKTLLPGARSIICLGLSYLGEQVEDLTSSNGGKVAQYARVKDYHRAMKRRMKTFVHGLEGRLEIPLAVSYTHLTLPTKD